MKTDIKAEYRFLGFLLAAALLLGLAGGGRAEGWSAEDYVTITALAQEVADAGGWRQTFESHGRTVTVDADIPALPDVDACPVVTVTGVDGNTLDPAAFSRYDGADIVNNGYYINVTRRDFAARMPHGKKDLIYFSSEKMYSRLYTKPEITLYNGEAPDRAPENVDLDYGQFLALLGDDLSRLTGLTMDDIRIDELCMMDAFYLAKTVNGQQVAGDPVTNMGNYCLQASEVVCGIPMFANMQRDLASPKGYLLYTYYSPTDYDFVFNCARKQSVIVQDVPLLSLTAMKRALQKQIDAGTLRGVDELAFGYLAFLQGSWSDPTWVLLPVWQMEGGYSADLKKEHVMPYHDPRDTDGSLTVPMGYTTYYYSAQTGEMLSLAHHGDRNAYPACEVVTWDAIKAS